MSSSPAHPTATPSNPGRRSALVFGATGFIGRWLVKELLDQGVPTTAVVRAESSAAHLHEWLSQHGVTSLPETVQADFDRDDLGWRAGTAAPPSEVYNVAGAYAFGMTVEQARSANVDTTRRIVAYAASQPTPPRLVYLSGYRVGGQDPASVPWTTERVQREYSRLGAYEASKVESDAVVQADAGRLGVPLTIVNPASVIGDSLTGETPQALGLAATVLDLLAGRIPALPGGRDTFVPVVTVDYLAKFMVLLPTRADTTGQAYWVLDEKTPALPELLALIGRHHGVKVPRLRIPVRVLKALPARITRTDPETLSFLSSDRYPTGPAQAIALQHDLAHRDVDVVLRLWSTYLQSHHAEKRDPSLATARPPASKPQM